MSDESDKEATVNYIVITGSTETDESIESICTTIRHSLRTQFPCKHVHIAIEEHFPESELPSNGGGYY
jgi:hypothetical protein